MRLFSTAVSAVILAAAPDNVFATDVARPTGRENVNDDKDHSNQQAGQPPAESSTGWLDLWSAYASGFLAHSGAEDEEDFDYGSSAGDDESYSDGNYEKYVDDGATSGESLAPRDDGSAGIHNSNGEDVMSVPIEAVAVKPEVEVVQAKSATSRWRNPFRMITGRGGKAASKPLGEVAASAVPEPPRGNAIAVGEGSAESPPVEKKTTMMGRLGKGVKSVLGSFQKIVARPASSDAIQTERGDDPAEADSAPTKKSGGVLGSMKKFYRKYFKGKDSTGNGPTGGSKWNPWNWGLSSSRRSKAATDNAAPVIDGSGAGDVPQPPITSAPPVAAAARKGNFPKLSNFLFGKPKQRPSDFF